MWKALDTLLVLDFLGTWGALLWLIALAVLILLGVQVLRNWCPNCGKLRFGKVGQICPVCRNSKLRDINDTIRTL